MCSLGPCGRLKGIITINDDLASLSPSKKTSRTGASKTREISKLPARSSGTNESNQESSTRRTDNSCQKPSIIPSMNQLRSTNQQLTLNHKPKVLSQFPSLHAHFASINKEGLFQKKMTPSPKSDAKSQKYFKSSQDNNLPTFSR
ncbi:hypothetical protein L3X38_019021 [Prunus dulcis]|uniref:Uncharacterized protein n=1 Tax=Prunus dulcis TaxID=3755 RepID=A0AAD4WAE1_PRUDU|nr:hypothetical protein L3X38_019021 [Prunus dulcis]